MSETPTPRCGACDSEMVTNVDGMLVCPRLVDHCATPSVSDDEPAGEGRDYRVELFEALHANDAEKIVAAFDGLRAHLTNEAASLTERAERAEAAHEELRRACADIIGADVETWPAHGNVGLAVASALALREMDRPNAEIGAALRAALATVPDGTLFLRTPTSADDDTEVWGGIGHRTFINDELAALAALLCSPVSPAREDGQP
jgi:hypothetical protein